MVAESEYHRTVVLDDESATLAAKPGDVAASDDLPDALEPGQRIGRYIIRDELGRGGMGVVYRAHDPTSIGRWRSSAFIRGTSVVERVSAWFAKPRRWLGSATPM